MTQVNIPPEPPFAAFQADDKLSYPKPSTAPCIYRSKGDPMERRLRVSAALNKKKLKFGATILVQPSPPRGEIYLSSAGHGEKRNGLRVSDNDTRPVASMRDKRGWGLAESMPSRGI